MKNNLVIAIFPIVAFLMSILAGCQPKENKVQLKAINQSLERSNDLIKDASRRSLEEMEVKHREMPAEERIVEWLSIMNKIKAETDGLANIVDNVKEQTLTFSDDLSVKGTAVLDSLPQPNGLGYRLLSKLTSFKDSLHAFFNVPDSVDGYNVYYKKDITLLRKAGPLLPDYAEGLNEEQRSRYINKWLENNFKGSSPLMTMVVLNKLKSDILFTRTMLMDYCNSKVGILDGPGSYEKFCAIMSLSSSYVKRGETIELTAGAGGFSTARKPAVIISGKEIRLDEQGVALYKFKATGKPGRHIIPVKIEFTRNDGSRDTVTKMVEYIIADEK